MEEQIDYAVWGSGNIVADLSLALAAVNWVNSNGSPMSGVTLTHIRGRLRQCRVYRFRNRCARTGFRYPLLAGRCRAGKK